MAGRRRAGSACYANAAWAFLGHWPDPAAFAAEPLARQLALVASQRPFVTFLMLTGRLRPGYDYLAHRKIGGLLVQARRGVFAGDIARFATAATDLDYGGHIVKRTTERVVLRLLIQTGRPLDEVVVADVDELAAAFRRCAEAKGNRSSWVNDRSLVYAAHRVLFHLGVLDTPPEDPRRRPGLAGHYSGVDEPLRSLFLDYCDQAAATRAPATVKAIASHLAGFGRFLASLDPPVTDLAVLDRRTHIEAWLAALAAAHHPRWHRDVGGTPTRADPHRPPVPHRHPAVGVARGPHPHPDLSPRHSPTAATVAALSAAGRRPAPDRHARGPLGARADAPDAAARRRAAVHPRHRTAHRRAPRAGTGLRARDRRPRRLAEGAARQARHRTDGAARPRNRRHPRPDRRPPHPGRPLPHPRTGRPVEFLLVHQGRRISAQALRAELDPRRHRKQGVGKITLHHTNSGIPTPPLWSTPGSRCRR